MSGDCGRVFPFLALLCLALGTASCSIESRKRVADVLFEGKPGNTAEQGSQRVVRDPRRPPAYAEREFIPRPEIDPAVIARNELFQRDWKVFLRDLPKDATGRVDWVAALDQGRIHPAPGIEEGSVDLPVLPMDVVLEPEAQPLFKAVFPHKAHTEWLTCNNCHMQLFQMQAGADDISMASIFAGKHCGACHGKVAFEVSTGCARCHPVLAGPQ